MSLQIVQQFATAVDSNRYEDAAKLLAVNCEYHYSEGNYQGRVSVINIYRMNHLQMKKMFDEVMYSSWVDNMTNGLFKINFLDKIRKGALWHELRSSQLIKCQNEFIVDIEHRDVAGEAEGLRAFYTKTRNMTSRS
jgi:hypothetical protein